MMFFLSALIVLQVVSAIAGDGKHILKRIPHENLPRFVARQGTGNCPLCVYQWTSVNRGAYHPIFTLEVIPSVLVSI